LKHKLLRAAVVAVLVGLAGAAIWKGPRRSALSERERALLASIPDTPTPGSTSTERAPPNTWAWPTPPRKPCVGTIREYCQEQGGKCPTYAQSVEGVKKLCENRALRIVVEHCVGGCRSISVDESDKYFDASGKLVAASVFSDVMGSFCVGANTKTYGRIPVCSTEYVKVDVCKDRGQPADGG
jgi:hypothetical protein